LDQPTLDTLTTVGGVGLVTTIVVEIILRALAWTDAQKGRFAPLLAVFIGIVFAELAVLGLGLTAANDFVTALLVGIFGGATAIGIHDVTTGLASG
jgi:hypothetical protein